MAIIIIPSGSPAAVDFAYAGKQGTVREQIENPRDVASTELARRRRLRVVEGDGAGVFVPHAHRDMSPTQIAFLAAPSPTDGSIRPQWMPLEDSESVTGHAGDQGIQPRSESAPANDEGGNLVGMYAPPASKLNAAQRDIGAALIQPQRPALTSASAVETRPWTMPAVTADYASSASASSHRRAPRTPAEAQSSTTVVGTVASSAVGDSHFQAQGSAADSAPSSRSFSQSVLQEMARRLVGEPTSPAAADVTGSEGGVGAGRNVSFEMPLWNGGTRQVTGVKIDLGSGAVVLSPDTVSVTSLLQEAAEGHRWITVQDSTEREERGAGQQHDDGREEP